MNVFTHYQGLLDVFTKCGKDSGFQIPSPVLSLKKLNPPDAIWSELGIVGGMLSLKNRYRRRQPERIRRRLGPAARGTRDFDFAAGADPHR
jgi:hypothetical protein